MKFAQPYILHYLWALIFLAIFLIWATGRRRRLLQQFAEEPLLKEIAAEYSPRRQTVKNVLLLFVFWLSIVALARPQWGFEWQEVKRQGLDIVVAIDTSKSMLTQDVKPNRLERTKLAVQDLVKKLEGDRIGLIAFAGEAFWMCPLTVDYSGFLLSLNDLDVHAIPRGGTNIAQAIEEAFKAYEKAPGQYKALIIVTDGDNLEGDPVAAAREAKEKGIKVFTVGIGTREGELIQIENEVGQKEFLKDARENFVKSRLNEKLLEDIALSGGGAYVRSSGAQFGLDLIYEKELSKLERREIEAEMEKKYFERFQIPLFFAILLLVVEACLTTRIKKK